MDKLVESAAAAVADLHDGASIAVGGFGLAGVPFVLIDALAAHSACNLTVVSNNCGADGAGLAILLAERRITRIIASYVGNNRELERQYLAGEVQLELTPQGTLAERLRAGGCGIGAFYTPAGVDSQVSAGGLPWRYTSNGDVAIASPPREVRSFTVRGRTRPMVLEEAITTDFALVRAAVADRHGNATFHATARNFNPIAAMAGGITVLEAEQVVDPGAIDPDAVHLPGIFVQRVVALTPQQASSKRIERRTVSGS